MKQDTREEKLSSLLNRIANKQFAGQKKLLTIPGKRPLNQIYVKEAIKIIDKLVEEEGDDDAE